MIRPSSIYLTSPFSPKKRIESPVFLKKGVKINSNYSRVGIKFADNSAVQNKVLTTPANGKPATGHSPKLSVTYIPACNANTGHSLPVSFVTKKVFWFGVDGSNEPPVLCQSTFH
jgi:hypothetical protein